MHALFAAGVGNQTISTNHLHLALLLQAANDLQHDFPSTDIYSMPCALYLLFAGCASNHPPASSAFILLHCRLETSPAQHPLNLHH
jgi:hypothetical protein